MVAYIVYLCFDLPVEKETKIVKKVSVYSVDIVSLFRDDCIEKAVGPQATVEVDGD